MHSYRKCGHTPTTTDFDVRVSERGNCEFALRVARAFYPHFQRRDFNATLYVKSAVNDDTIGLKCSAGAHAVACDTARGTEVWLG